MAVEFEKLQFKKNWNNASDFPTYEENEAQVRADLQALHDETKEFINEKLIPSIENLAVPGAGDMKADVYDPEGKRLDVFRFAEDKKAEAVDALRQHIDNQSNPHKVTADQVQVTENVVNAFKETGNWSVDGILTQIGSTLFGGEVLYQWMRGKGTVVLNTTGEESFRSLPVTMYQSSEVSVDSTGKISLVNPTTMELTNMANQYNVPSGYFYPSTSTGLTKVYRATSSTRKTVSLSQGIYYATLSNVETWLPAVSGNIVTSEDPNAYTDGYVDDEGYTYTGLDPITAFVPRIQTGSYTGTGTYGANNPCSLTFSFVPKFVLVMRSTSTTHVATSGTSLTWTGQPGVSSGGDCAIALSDKTLSWYGTSAVYQLNVSNNTYNWIAIG